MSVDLEKLNIIIESDSKSATKAVDELVSSLRDLKGTLGGLSTSGKQSANGIKTATSEIRDLGKVSSKSKQSTEELADANEKVSTSATKAGKSSKDAGEDMKEGAKGAKTFGDKMKGLWSSIGRIAMYRAIRTALKGVTNAVKEGITILVDWDRTYGNNTSNAAKTVDELSAKWRQVEKAVGAAVMPIIQLFQPVLMKLMDGIIKIFEFIQQIARSLLGYKTYMRAVYKETNKTVGATKELQRILFGFDELNVLPSDTGSGSSSDVGRWEYEEVPIDSKFLNGIADLTNYIRDLIGENETLQGIFDGILGTLLALGGITVLNGLRKLGGLLKDLGAHALDALGHVKDLWAKLSESIMVNVVFPAKEAITNAANAVYGWAKDALTKTAIVIRTAVASAVSAAQEVWETVSEWVATKVLVFKTAVASAASSLSAAFQAAAEWLSSRWLIFRTSVASAISSLSAAFQAAKTWLALRWLTIKTVVQSATAKIEAVFNAAKAWLALRWLTIKTTVQSAMLKASAVFESVRLWFAARVATIRTAVASATTRAAIVWAKAKAVLSVPITIPVLVGVGALALLPSLISSLQTLANGSPVSIPITLGTSGLASALSSLWTSIQKFWNDNVITVRFKAGAETTPKAKTTPNKGAQLWADEKASLASSSAATSSLPNPYANMSATDLQNYAESTGLNLTAEDKKALGYTVAGVTTLGVAPVALAAGASAGGLASMASLLKGLSPLLGFASGGVPSMGTLFYAGERGAEVVADMGSRTGVMNVSQMEAAVANGNENVVNALYSAATTIVNAFNNKNFDVYMDSAKVGKSVTNYQNNAARRTGVPQLIGG